MKQGINVLSFFDGMSAGQDALRQLGVKVNRYIAIEIEPKAIAITQANFPNTEQRGDILLLYTDMKNFVATLPKIDLIFAGSPCQGFSRSGKGEGFEHPRSKLFFTFVEIFNEIKAQQNNPDIPFFFENVVMHQKWAKEISKTLGVKEELYQAMLYSPNSRSRFYWTNLNPPKAIIEKYKQESGWKTYQDILVTKSPSVSRVVQKPDISKAGKSAKNKFNWYKTKRSWSLGSLYHNHSQGYRVGKINIKMPCFTASGRGVNKGLGAYGFDANNFLKESISLIKQTPDPLIITPSQIQAQKLGITETTYIVCRPAFSEALEAMGFSSDYFDEKSVQLLSEADKIRGIGNSWHVTIVKLLIEWYCRTNGWMNK